MLSFLLRLKILVFHHRSMELFLLKTFFKHILIFLVLPFLII